MSGHVKGCVQLENTPKIPRDVLEKTMVTTQEIYRAIQEIEQKRIEDNKPRIRKLFEKILKKGDNK